MISIVIPEMQKIVVPEMSYGDLRRAGYELEVSPTLARYDNGDFAGRKTRDQALQILTQEGCQLPNMFLLWHLAAQEGRDSPFFDDAFARTDGAYRWEHTGTKLVKAGNDPHIRDVFEYQNREWIQIAEGQRMPLGEGRRIVEANPITGLPIETTDSNAEHIGHWYFNSDLSENIVLFGCYWYYGGHDRCFSVYANYEPSCAGDYIGGFRPVRGSFGEVEKAAKMD